MSYAIACNSKMVVTVIYFQSKLGLGGVYATFWVFRSFYAGMGQGKWGSFTRDVVRMTRQP